LESGRAEPGLVRPAGCCLRLVPAWHGMDGPIDGALGRPLFSWACWIRSVRMQPQHGYTVANSYGRLWVADAAETPTLSTRGYTSYMLHLARAGEESGGVLCVCF
jgi:hypothetical protein